MRVAANEPCKPTWYKFIFELTVASNPTLMSCANKVWAWQKSATLMSIDIGVRRVLRYGEQSLTTVHISVRTRAPGGVVFLAPLITAFWRTCQLANCPGYLLHTL